MWKFKNRRVYLDYNATTPPHSLALKAVKQALKFWGNPSSVHQSAAEARFLLWKSRQNLARFIGCHPLEVIFTGSASEANNQALKGLCGKKGELIVSAVEHPSVSATADFLRAEGVTVHTIPVSRQGFLDEDFFEEVLSERTVLVSVMRAHNETGVLFPIKQLAQKAREKGAFFHSDMVQALGKEVVDMKGLGVDLASFSAHKMYGLKGCGALYCRKGVSPGALIHGGPQERGRRAGTENLSGVSAFGALAEKGDVFIKETEKLKHLRDRMEQGVLSSLSNVKVVGGEAPRLGNTSCLCISGVSGETLMMNLDLKGFSVSVGSACHSGKITADSSLKNMGWTEEEALSSIRVSLGLGTAKRDVDLFVKTLEKTVVRLRSLKGRRKYG